MDGEHQQNRASRTSRTSWRGPGEDQQDQAGDLRRPPFGVESLTSDATQAEAVTIGSSSLVTQRDRRKMTASPRWEESAK